MGLFLFVLFICFLILYRFQSKGKEIDRKIATEKHKKEEAIRKAEEKKEDKRRIQELEDRIAELEEERDNQGY